MKIANANASTDTENAVCADKIAKDEVNSITTSNNDSNNDKCGAIFHSEDKKEDKVDEKSGQELIFIHETCFNIKIETPNSEAFVIPVCICLEIFITVLGLKLCDYSYFR